MIKYSYATSYTSLEELQRALLMQARHFRKLCPEVAATPLRPILLSPTKDPVIKKITPTSSDTDTLDALLGQVTILRNMRGQLTTNFPGRPQAVSAERAINALLTQVEGRADELRRKMGESARKSVSETLVRTNHALMTLLKDDLKGFNDGIAENYMFSDITPPGSANTIPAEVAFVQIKGLKDSSGYRHPAPYYIVIAKPLHERNSYYIATTTDFKTPKRLRWDSTARNNGEILKIVKALLAQEGIIGRAFTRNIPVPQSRIKFAHDNVKSTTVKGDVILVKVKDVKTIDATRDELYGQLASIVRRVDPKNRDMIRDKILRDTGVIQFVFSLPAKLRGRLIDKDTLSKLKNLLHLSESEVVRIRTALEDPE